MKTTHVRPLISATTRRADSTTDGADKSKEPVIRLKLDNPPHWDWQLTTTADALPVIQLLDKDGRLLVETSGFVAQRARGSFRDGLRTYESFAESPKEATPEAAPPKVVTGNRNFEGFSNKYGSTFCGFRPRKSRSEATVSSVSSGPRNGRKRHSSNASELKSSSPSSASWKESAIKRYSAGDYLRHQILEDLSRRSDVARLPPNEVAQNRYKRMREYLRSQSDSIHGSVIASEESPRNSFKSHQNVAEVSANVERKEPTLAERTLNKEDIEKIRRFLQEKIQAKMRQEQFLSRNSSFPTEYNQQTHNNEMKSPVEESNEASYSNYIREDEKQGSLRDYRTRKIRSDANIRLDSEIIETKGKAESKQQKSIKKNSSGSEKKKVYRKTKSDLLISHRLAGSSFDSEKDCSLTNYPTRRIKSQDNFERSWREYKERKKLERSQKDTDHHSLMEEDFMAKPRWKDLQEAACTVTNCKICENKSSCVDPTKDSEPGSATSETKKENNDRPGTSLQENYLRIDRSKATESKTIVKERQDRNGSSSPDFGYNSISKRNRMINELGGSCANSNVKKSDTFKIVDGGGDDDDDDEADGNDNCGRVCYDYRNKTNEDIATDYFRRVYELLRLRREEAKRLAEGRIDEGREDTSSSNYLQEEAQIKKRRRRRKMEKLPEVEFCQYRWRRLKQYFSKERQKRDLCEPSKTSFKFYHKMLFMDAHIYKRKTLRKRQFPKVDNTDKVSIAEVDDTKVRSNDSILASFLEKEVSIKQQSFDVSSDEESSVLVNQCIRNNLITKEMANIELSHSDNNSKDNNSDAVDYSAQSRAGYNFSSRYGNKEHPTFNNISNIKSLTPTVSLNNENKDVQSLQLQTLVQDEFQSILSKLDGIDYKNLNDPKKDEENSVIAKLIVTKLKKIDQNTKTKFKFACMKILYLNN